MDWRSANYQARNFLRDMKKGDEVLFYHSGDEKAVVGFASVSIAMMSNHFPMTYGHPYGWLVLVALMAIGAWVRHFFNLRNQGRVVWVIPATAALGVLILAIAIARQHADRAGPR